MRPRGYELAILSILFLIFATAGLFRVIGPADLKAMVHDILGMGMFACLISIFIIGMGRIT